MTCWGKLFQVRAQEGPIADSGQLCTKDDQHCCSVVVMQDSFIHFWHAPLRLRSAKRRHHSPRQMLH